MCSSGGKSDVIAKRNRKKLIPNHAIQGLVNQRAMVYRYICGYLIPYPKIIFPIIYIESVLKPLLKSEVLQKLNLQK